MNRDTLGITYTSSQDLFDLLYKQPDIDISRFLVTDPDEYNGAVKFTYAELSFLDSYTKFTNGLEIEAFDQEMQSRWNMPEDYLKFDIAAWLLGQCDDDAELQRVGHELLLYQERDLFNLLRYMKYLVDTLRANNIVWGVGRGSSVSSFVLYKMGVHKINSLYYDLDPAEFLK
jgi:hypothetical protein